MSDVLNQKLCTSFPRRPLRVVALGDCNSNTIDPLQGTVPFAFQDVVEAYGGRAILDNLGFGMSTCREGLWRILRYKQKADIQLINYGLVDAWVTTIPAFYVPYVNESRTKYFVRRILKLTKRRLRAKWLRRVVPTGPVVGEAEFVQSVSQMTYRFHQLNPSGEVVIWSTPMTDDEDRNENLKRYNDLLQEIAAERNLIFIDSNAELAGLAFEDWHLDSVHLSKLAASIIAEQAYLRIAERREDRFGLNRRAA